VTKHRLAAETAVCLTVFEEILDAPPSPIAVVVLDRSILAKETSDIGRYHTLNVRGGNGSRAAECCATRVELALAAAAHATKSGAADGLVGIRNALNAQIEDCRSVRRRIRERRVATSGDGEVIEGEASVGETKQPSEDRHPTSQGMET